MVKEPSHKRHGNPKCSYTKQQNYKIQEAKSNRRNRKTENYSYSWRLNIPLLRIDAILGRKSLASILQNSTTPATDKI